MPRICVQAGFSAEHGLGAEQSSESPSKNIRELFWTSAPNNADADNLERPSTDIIAAPRAIRTVKTAKYRVREVPSKIKVRLLPPAPQAVTIPKSTKAGNHETATDEKNYGHALMALVPQDASHVHTGCRGQAHLHAEEGGRRGGHQVCPPGQVLA